jgi:hypothetical protein
VQPRWQARSFTTEDKNEIARARERDVPEESLRPCGEKVRLSERRKFLLECIPAWPYARIHMFPVVKAGALDLAFMNRKSQRFDEVQSGADGEAGTPGISCIPVNFGMHEYDVRRHYCFTP